MTIETLQTVLAKMDVPHHKLDASKPGAAKWLLDNLRVRNLHHQFYVTAMMTLIELARTKNWMKASELRQYSEHVALIVKTAEQVKSKGLEPRVDPAFGPSIMMAEHPLPANGLQDVITQHAVLTGKSYEVAKAEVMTASQNLSDAYKEMALARGTTVTGRIPSRPEMQELPARRASLSMPALGAAHARLKSGKTVIGEQLAAEFAKQRQREG